MSENLKDKYISTDRHGRPIGIRGSSEADKLDLAELEKKERMTMISDLANIASTLYGGANILSGIQELGFKEFLKKSVNPLDNLKENINLFTETPREGLKSFLPDLRPDKERFGINPEFSSFYSGLDDVGKDSIKSQVLSLFDEEQLSRLNADEMLSIFDDK